MARSGHQLDKTAEQQTAGPPVIVGITGSSGAVLACRAVEVLGDLGVPMHITYTPACLQVWPDEVGRLIQDDLAAWKDRFGARIFNPNDFRAPMSNAAISRAACSSSPARCVPSRRSRSGPPRNLVERAADVALKEQRPLALVPREAPLSAIHLENLLKLARLGVRIVPPVPQFYLRPQTFDEMVDALARRALASLGIEEALPPTLRWRGDEE